MDTPSSIIKRIADAISAYNRAKESEANLPNSEANVLASIKSLGGPLNDTNWHLLEEASVALAKVKTEAEKVKKRTSEALEEINQIIPAEILEVMRLTSKSLSVRVFTDGNGNGSVNETRINKSYNDYTVSAGKSNQVEFIRDPV